MPFTKAYRNRSAAGYSVSSMLSYMFSGKDPKEHPRPLKKQGSLTSNTLDDASPQSLNSAHNSLNLANSNDIIINKYIKTTNNNINIINGTNSASIGNISNLGNQHLVNVNGATNSHHGSNSYLNKHKNGRKSDNNRDDLTLSRDIEKTSLLQKDHFSKKKKALPKHPWHDKQLSWWNHFCIGSYWFGWAFLWMPLFVVIIPHQIEYIIEKDESLSSINKGSTMGHVFLAGSIGSLIFSPLFGHISDCSKNAMGRRRPFLVVGIAVTTFGLLIMSLSPPFTIYCIAFFICSSGSFITLAPYSALVPDVVPFDQRGICSGWLGACSMFGYLLGGAVSYHLEKLGFFLTFIFLAAIHGFFGWITVKFVPEIGGNELFAVMKYASKKKDKLTKILNRNKNKNNIDNNINQHPNQIELQNIPNTVQNKKRNSKYLKANNSGNGLLSKLGNLIGLGNNDESKSYKYSNVNANGDVNYDGEEASFGFDDTASESELSFPPTPAQSVHNSQSSNYTNNINNNKQSLAMGLNADAFDLERSHEIHHIHPIHPLRAMSLDDEVNNIGMHEMDAMNGEDGEISESDYDWNNVNEKDLSFNFVTNKPRITVFEQIMSFFDSFPFCNSDFMWLFISRFWIQLGAIIVQENLQYYLKDTINKYDILGITVAKDEVQAVAVLFAPLLFGGFISSIVSGIVSDLYGQERKWLVYLSGSMMCICCLLFGINSYFLIDIVIALMFGFGFGVFSAIDWAMATDVLPNALYYGRDMGLWNLAFTLPQIIGTPMTGLIIDTFKQWNYIKFGWFCVFLFSSISFIVGTMLVHKIRHVK